MNYTSPNLEKKEEATTHSQHMTEVNSDTNGMRFWNTAVLINGDDSGIKCSLVSEEETILEEVGKMQTYQRTWNKHIRTLKSNYMITFLP
jgi:hypothetical protein